MTTASPSGATFGPANRPGLRGLLVPTIVAGAVAVGVAAAARGWEGTWGALVGGGLVLGFFTATHLVLDRTRALPPELTLVIALGLYTVKVVALALTFVLLSGLDLLGEPLHRAALALTVICCTLAWTGAEVLAAVRAHLPTYRTEGNTP